MLVPKAVAIPPVSPVGAVHRPDTSDLPQVPVKNKWGFSHAPYQLQSTQTPHGTMWLQGFPYGFPSAASLGDHKTSPSSLHYMKLMKAQTTALLRINRGNEIQLPLAQLPGSGGESKAAKR